MSLELWPGGPQVANAPGVFPVGTDGVLLADFAARPGRKQILDLGCGSGLIFLLLCHNAPGVSALGLDLSPAAVSLAAENIGRNGLGSRCQVLQGDIKAYQQLLPAGCFDLAVANPPYFPAAPGADPARAEAACTLADFCAAAAYALKNGGDLAMVHRPERLAVLLSAMSGAGLEPKRLRFASPTVEAAPSLVLVEARKGAKPGLDCLPPLILKNDCGGPGPELCRIYHMD